MGILHHRAGRHVNLGVIVGDTLYDLLGKMSSNLQAAYDSLPEIRKDEQSETLV